MRSTVEAGSNVECRLVQSRVEMDAVYRVAYEAYLEAGYISPRRDGLLIHYPHLDFVPETGVLVALVNDLIVGTLSFTLDGPRGLPMDQDFGPACRALREEGRRMSACWRLATRCEVRAHPAVIMSLIQGAISSLSNQADTSLFVFNPRHERIYRRLLGMEVVARSAHTRGLRNAPGVLMRLDVERLPDRCLAGNMSAPVSNPA